MNIINNLKTSWKLILSFSIVGICMIIVSAFGITSLNSANTDVTNIYNDRLLPIQNLGAIQTQMMQLRGDVFKYQILPEERPTILNNIKKAKDDIAERLDTYQAGNLFDQEIDGLNELELNYAEYQKQMDAFIKFVDDGKEEEAHTLIVDGGSLANSRKAVGNSISKLIDINIQIASDLKAKQENTYRYGWITTMVFGLLSFFFSIVLAFLLTTSINKPLQIITHSLNLLKVGNTSTNIEDKTMANLMARRDEFGDLSNSFAETRSYFLEMTKVAERIAQNDLTVKIEPKGSDDHLGNAFKGMVRNLNLTISQVADASSKVNITSNELAIASNQAGQATSQIATTIQQVASGTTQQADSITRTASSIEELGRAINGVAQGAQEQASAASRAAMLTAQLSAAIEQVAGNVGAVVKDSMKATDAAKRGAQTVEQTLSGMQSIKSAVGVSAQKVEQMGMRSDQIGSIITTIEDIASQTNLLALNAAIEAARAGEYGKGFAVVADEVRKLAERSSAATKEIGNLIRDIQNTVSEAVSAMNNGAKEVDSGESYANQAGVALHEILTAADGVRIQAEEAARAAEHMGASANELVSAVDSVSAVVEENTAATEEMAGSSTEVTLSIENIASVSEENSAAVEEVSASAEEMTAQVEEVSASAQELAALSDTLKEIVSKFKITA